MSGDLSSGDFDRFFRAVRTGVARPTTEQLASAPGPFTWQQRLVEELLDGPDAGRWPHLLDLPTGSGKTTTLDIALFVLACREDAPRRIVFVVDRRVIVQQAARWASELARQLQAAMAGQSDPVVEAVARRLAAKVAEGPRAAGRTGGDGCETVVVAAELRGGIAADMTWAQRPDVPAIITSTVDQVGSRLLMQGYGVSDSMRPVHAGLLANDVLFLLDEVHLSQPFAQTLAAVDKYRRRSRDTVWPNALDRWQVVQLSATPHGDSFENRFTLNAVDRTGILGQRLAARKPASVLVAPKPRGEADLSTATVRLLAESALTAAERREQPAVVAVVANRVAIAAAVADRLQRQIARTSGTDRPKVVLLTGRMRSYDRDQALAEYLPLVTTGRDRSNLTHHVFVVGTQSIEAGVDFDVDALITQAASIDALKQRFGRVDRLGELTAAGRPSSNVVICSAPTRQTGPDPVYGIALGATEEWLRECKQVDFGVDALVLPPDVGKMFAPSPRAPYLLPTHLNAWAQNPAPHLAPDVAAWLHGPDSEPDPDVSVVWRDGLVDRDVVFKEAMLAAVPIRSDEALDIPLSHVRRWLRQGSLGDLADVEGVHQPADSRPTGREPRRFTVMTPDGTVTGGLFTAIKPGDTVIVEGTEGGLRFGSWDPTATEAVQDLSVLPPRNAEGEITERPPVRLDLLLVELETYAKSASGADRLDEAEQVRAWSASCPCLVADPDLPPASSADVRRWLGEIPTPLGVGLQSGGPSLVRLRGLLDMVEADPSFSIVEIPSRDGAGTVVFVPQARRNRTPGSDRESSSTIGVRVGLSTHGEDTAQWAAAFLGALGLPEDEVSEHPVTIAARFHDIGKADRRFQLQLAEGQVTSELLAKSGIPADDWRRRRAAQVSSGYPRGARHEMLSAAMLARSPIMKRPDGELIGHLVASHHGRGRPFAPALRVADTVGPGEYDVHVGATSFAVAPHDMISVGSPIAEWFWHSLREHGWFGNAWLTALLRLADHQASRYPTSQTGGGTHD